MSSTKNGHSYPRELTIANGKSVTLRTMERRDADEVLHFARSLPPDDLLFLRSDITDPSIVDEWIRNVEKGSSLTLLAEIDGELAGYATVHLNEARWTRRIGEIRIQVGSAYRRTGLGRQLAAEIFDVARSHGVRKVTAMMTPDQVGARTVFEKLGFQVEALLTEWVEDRMGRPRDLIVMTHDLSGFSDHVTA
jgi:L-amino acid N-acyltransferase YncA